MLLSTIVVSTILAVDGALLRANNGKKHRNLQFFDFHSTVFQIAGVPLFPDEAELSCPDEWMAFVYCTALNCPDLIDTCPQSIFYNDEQRAPDADEVLGVGLNCSSVEKSFCGTYGSEGCCMMGCPAEVQALTSCVIQNTTGNNFKCDVYDCQALAEAEAEKKFLKNFQVEFFADRDTITALNGTDVSAGFFPTSFVPALGKVFFQASAGSTGYELWVTNDSLNGTQLVKDINPGENASLDETGSFAVESAELDGKLLFFANDGVHGKQLWRTNGREKGTFMVKGIGNDLGEDDDAVGVSVRQHGKTSMVKYDGNVYFTIAVDGEEDEVWMTDGTEEGTIQVGEDSIFLGGLKINSLIRLKGKTYFVASESPNGSDLFMYVSDGTINGTQKVSEEHIEEGHEKLVKFKGKVYFSAGSLWTTDGTEDGTVEIRGPGGAFLTPRSMTVAQGHLFFWTGCQLWSTDGSDDENGFTKLFAGPGGGASSCSRELVKLGSKILFRGGNPQQPFLTDGTKQGTIKLAEANMTSKTSFVVYNDQLALFAAERRDADFGHELWASDGTKEYTWVIPSIGLDQPGLYAHFDNLFVLGNAVYLTAWYLFGPGDEIWRVVISGDDYTQPGGVTTFTNLLGTHTDTTAAPSEDLVIESPGNNGSLMSVTKDGEQR